MTPSPLPTVTASPRERQLGYLSLFTSLGTLLCCALPSLLVLIGLGATVASVLSTAPWLVWLSRHKPWVFLASGLLIATNFSYLYGLAPRLRGSGPACSVNEGAACDTAGEVSRVVLWISAAVYAVGFFTAFILGGILTRFDR